MSPGCAIGYFSFGSIERVAANGETERLSLWRLACQGRSGFGPCGVWIGRPLSSNPLAQLTRENA